MQKELTTIRKAQLIAIITAVIGLLLFAVTEFAAYYIMVVKGVNFYLPLELSQPRVLPEAPRVLPEADTEPSGSYYELGWVPRYPNKYGYRGEEKNIEDAALAVFGDSYTKGHPIIEKSWPYLLEKKLKRPVLNFGVSGYGTDQAYLRFEKRYVNTLDTPYVALLIMSENIARIVNIYRGFYKRGRQSKPTKPRFYKQENGSIVLMPNPISGPEEIERLWDMEFLEEIGKYDYWYKYYSQYDLNHLARFPYSYYLLRALPYYVKRGYMVWIKNSPEYNELYRDDEATDILNYIIQRFVARANDSGAVPLVVFLPNWSDLADMQETKSTIYSPFIKAIRKEYHQYTFDAAEYFKPYLEQGNEITEYFISRLNGHYSPKGERVVSAGLYKTLMRVDAEKGFLGSEDMNHSLPQ